MELRGPGRSVRGGGRLNLPPFSDYTNGIETFTTIINLCFALILLRLRYKSEDAPMTKSQRWGLTIAAALYLTNTGVLLTYDLGNTLLFERPKAIDAYIHNYGATLNTLSFLALLCFGIVYPRPIARWRILFPILVFLAILWIPLLFIQSAYMVHDIGGGPRFLDNYTGFKYFLCTFIPIFLWLPEYDRQNSPQMRMTLTILIWGYLFYHVTVGMNESLVHLMDGTFRLFDGMVATFTVIVWILLIRSMYFRLGKWTIAEKTHLMMMVSSIIYLAFNYWRTTDMEVNSTVNHSGVLTLLIYLGTHGGWTIIRPTLFSYGLLRYQFLAPEIRAEKDFIVMGGIIGFSGVALLSVFFLDSFGTMARLGIGIGLGIMAYVPFTWLTRRIVSRLLPLSSGRKMSLAERRIIYLMSLQTAVVEGEIVDKEDMEALERLRKRLRVSSREHKILMAGFAKEKPTRFLEEIEEVYLFYKDGTLLGHVASKEMEAHGKKGMMATMFAAVKDFAKDALKAGTEHLDSIEYGYTTLLIEVEEDIALGVLLRGRDNPNVRQRMREVLAMVQKDHYLKIRERVAQEGDEERTIEGLDKVLKEFLEE